MGMKIQQFLVDCIKSYIMCINKIRYVNADSTLKLDVESQLEQTSPKTRTKGSSRRILASWLRVICFFAIVPPMITIQNVTMLSTANKPQAITLIVCSIVSFAAGLKGFVPDNTGYGYMWEMRRYMVRIVMGNLVLTPWIVYTSTHYPWGSPISIQWITGLILPVMFMNYAAGVILNMLYKLPYSLIAGVWRFAGLATSLYSAAQIILPSLAKNDTTYKTDMFVCFAIVACWYAVYTAMFAIFPLIRRDDDEFRNTDVFKMLDVLYTNNTITKSSAEYTQSLFDKSFLDTISGGALLHIVSMFMNTVILLTAIYLPHEDSAPTILATHPTIASGLSFFTIGMIKLPVDYALTSPSFRLKDLSTCMFATVLAIFGMCLIGMSVITIISIQTIVIAKYPLVSMWILFAASTFFSTLATGIMDKKTMYEELDYDSRNTYASDHHFSLLGAVCGVWFFYALYTI